MFGKKPKQSAFVSSQVIEEATALLEIQKQYLKAELNDLGITGADFAVLLDKLAAVTESMKLAQTKTIKLNDKYEIGLTQAGCLSMIDTLTKTEEF